jgi:hypothetical protein
MTDRIQFSAKFDAIHAIGAPTDAPVSRVRDVLICATGGADVSIEEIQAHPPIASAIEVRLRGGGEPVDRGRGVYIDSGSGEDVEVVMNACSLRGHYFAPIRQFGQRYSFIRDVDDEEWREHPFRWDETGVLNGHVPSVGVRGGRTEPAGTSPLFAGCASPHALPIPRSARRRHAAAQPLRPDAGLSGPRGRMLEQLA